MVKIGQRKPPHRAQNRGCFKIFSLVPTYTELLRVASCFVTNQTIIHGHNDSSIHHYLLVSIVYYTNGHFVLVKGSFSLDFVSCTFQPNHCFIAEHFQISEYFVRSKFSIEQDSVGCFCSVGEVKDKITEIAFSLKRKGNFENT